MWTWLKRFGRSTSRRNKSAQTKQLRRPRLDLERLEDRTVPAVSALSQSPTALFSDTAAGNVQGIASASKDGRYVVYTDTAANLAPGQVMDSKSAYNVFLYDRAEGDTVLVSHASNSSSTAARGDSRNAVISADGKYVAFVSNSDNLVSNAKLANDTYYVSLGWVTGGTFKLTYDGQTTSGLAHNATAADVQTAIANLTGVGSSNVSVSGSGGSTGVYTISFTGSLANGAAKPLSADGSTLTHSSSIVAVGFKFAGGENEFLCDQYSVYLYDVANNTNKLVSHGASDQGTGYQSLLGEGTSGLLTGTQGSFGASNGLAATRATSVSISGDGKYVTYLSTATKLVNGQENAHPSLLARGYYTPANVFVYDRGSDTNYLVSDKFGTSTNSAGAPITPGDYTAFVAIISENGNTIAFGSQATNLADSQRVSLNDGNGPGETQQWFVTNRPTSSTWADAPTNLVSHNTRGNNFESVTNSSGDLVDYPAPAVSADGKWIAYQSSNVIVTLASASNAAAGDNFYLYNNDASSSSHQSNTLVSHKPGNTLNAGSGYTYTYLTTTGPGPAISDDGRYVAFVSRSTDLVSGTTTSAGFNYFVFDRDASDASNNVTRVSKSSIPTSFVSSTATFHPLTPSISGDGKYIAHIGKASDAIGSLTVPAGTSALDALLYDVTATTHALVSRATASATTTSNDNARWAVVSNNGSAVFFASDATNLIPAAVSGRTGLDNNGGTDLFAYSRSNTGLTYTPQASAGANATATLHHLDSATSANSLPSLTSNGISEVSPVGSVSDDGRFTVFMSSAVNVASGQVDANRTLDVFLYDKSSGTRTLLSRKGGSTSVETGNGLSTNAVISGDGKTVAFYSFATDLISGSTVPSDTVQLYLYDNDSASANFGKLKLVSFANGTSNGSNAKAPFAPSNSTLLYSGSSTTFLGITLTTIDGLALPGLSSDGKYIAYLTDATNLLSSSTGTARVHVFLYDVQNNVNRLVSGASGATTPTGANGNSSAVSISADGTTVAFFSKATNLLGTSTSGHQMFVWSRVANTATGLGAAQTVLATHTASNDNSSATVSSSAELPLGALPPSLSSDGKYVAYYFGGSDLVSIQSGTARATNVFRYDVNANTNTLVSHAAGSTTTAGDNPTNNNRTLASGPAISSNGRYVAYANNSTNLLSTSSPLTGQSARDNVYLWDASSGNNTLVSHAAGSATTATGGTSASISDDGRYVAFIDVALDNNAHPECAFTDTASVRVYDAQATATTEPAAVGKAFNPTLMKLVGASLAPTAISGNGSVVVWDGLASNNVSGDRNGNLDVFLADNDTRQFTITAGNNQQATVNTAFTTNLTVKLTNADGTPISGVNVTFVAPTTTTGPTGTFTGSSTVTTDGSGIATAPTFTANTKSGSYTVTATLTGTTTSLQFTLTNNPGPVNSITPNTSTTLNVPVTTAPTTAFQVSVTDQHGNGVPNVNVTFVAPTTTTPLNPTGTFTGGSATAIVSTNASGVATAPTFTANTKAGGYTVTATPAGLTTGVSFNITNSPGAASSVTNVTTTSQGVTVNTAVGTPFKVTVTDQHGNPVSGVNVTYVAPTTTTGPTGAFAGGAATAIVSTGSDGTATAPAFTANTKAGTYSVTVTAAGVSAGISFNVTNNPAAAASISADAGTPQTAPVTTAFVTTLQAKVSDQFGNAIPGVNVSFVAPTTSTGPTGTFAGGSATAIVSTNASGVATAPTFTANTKSGGYTVTATAAGVTTGVNFILTNSAGAASSVTSVTTTAQGVTVNNAVGTPFKVTVTDQHGNPISGVNVTFTAPTTTTGPTGAFAGGAATAIVSTGSDGTATAPAFTANTKTGTYAVTATVTGVSSGPSFNVTNNPGAVSTITVAAGTPQSVGLNTAFGTTLQAKVSDSFGNAISAVNVTFVAPSSGAGGTFTGGVTTVIVATGSDGIAKAPNFTSNGTAGSYVVTATTSGVSGSAQFSLTNQAPVVIPPVVAPPVVHVDPDWINVPVGSDPDGSGPATAFGPGGDAFASLSAADAAVAAGGTLVLHAGTYVGAVNVSRAGSVVLAESITINASGGDVVFNVPVNGAAAGGQDLTIIAGGGDVFFNRPVGATAALKSITISGADDVLFAGVVNVTEDLNQPNGTGKTTFNGGTVGDELRVTTEEVVFASGTTSAASVVIHVLIAAVVEGDAVLKATGKIDMIIDSTTGATVDLEGAADAPSVSVMGGAGPDTILLNPKTGGAIAVDGGGGSNLLEVDLTAIATAQTVLVAAQTVSGTALSQALQYKATGGTFGRGVTVMTGAGNDTAFILGTQAGAPTKVMTGAGNDQVRVTSATDLARSVLNTIAAEVTIDAGAGANSLVVSEAARTAPESLFVTDTTLGSSLIPVPIRYAATGGSFAGGFTLISGSAGDTFVILSTPKGAPTTVYAQGGDDVIQITPSAGKPLASLAIDAGAGFDRLAVLPQSAGAVVRDYADSGAALFRVSFLQGDVSTVWYGAVEQTGSAVSQEQSFVQSLYHDVLGWNAGEGDLRYWVDVLNAGAGKNGVASAIANSPAALAKTVRDWYQDYLGFTPANGGEQWLVQAMQAGMSREDALSLLLGSPLYYGLAGNTDAAFVTSLFEDLLGGKPSADQLQVYVSTLLPRLGRDGVAWLILSSEQHRRKAIGDTIADLYDRPATAAEVEAWAVSALTLDEIEVRLALSPDFV